MSSPDPSSSLFRHLRTRLAVAGLLHLGLMVNAAQGATPAFTLYQTGNAADVTPAKTRAGLLLAGGGGDNDDAFRWFVQCAGGGDLVVLRASGKDGYNDYLSTQIGGVDSVVTIVFHARDASTDPRVLGLIAQAEAIFLAGGDQSNYVNYWKDTPVAAALNAHVRAGKPLGGTSAGLAVLGQFAYSALLPGDLTTPRALANPFDPQITLETDFLHLDLLRGVITDTHFMARARLGRALVFLARLAADQPTGARLLGIGVDERTALCIEPDGIARVFSSDPAGRAWLLIPTQSPEVLAPAQPLTYRKIQVMGLGPESSYNLQTTLVANPTALSTVSVVAGQLSQEP